MIRRILNPSLCIWFLLVSAGLAAAEQSALERPVKFNIAAQPLARALNEFATQADVSIVFYPSSVQGLMAPQLAGDYIPQDALRVLLGNSKLKYRFTDPRTVSVSLPGEPQPPAFPAAAQPQAALMRLVEADEHSKPLGMMPVEESSTAAGDEKDQPADTKGIPEILVKGKKSINADIQRTEDDVQPYVVFDSKDIDRSLSQNLEDFLKRQLPMNQSFATNAQQGETAGNVSSIDLRGLGYDETLILLNGRRLPGVSQINAQGDIGQADINGIPLAAVERIEILPATASGIYGGGATGGVINIILKSDFKDVEVRTTYDNSFDTDSGARRLDITAGFNLEEGRTSVLLSGSYSDSNEMVIADREFVDRGRALYLSNVPITFSSFQIPLSATTNVRAVDSFETFEPLELMLRDPNGGPPIPLGSSTTYVPNGYAGVQSDGGAGLIANAGNFNIELPRDVQGMAAGILNAPVVTSFGANLRRQFTPRLEAFIDLSWNRNEGHIQEASDFNQYILCPAPGSEPNLEWCWNGEFDAMGEPIALFSAGNPFTVPVEVRFPMPGLSFDRVFNSESQVANGGFIVRLPRHWIAQAEYSWSRSRTESSETSPIITDEGIAAIDSGAVSVFRDMNIFVPDYSASNFSFTEPNRFTGPLDNSRSGATLRLAGPIYDLPGGPVAVSIFAERRKSEADLGILRQSTGPIYYLPRSEEVDSVSVEARVPLFSQRNARPWRRALDVQAAVRYDDYSIYGPESGTAELIDGAFVVQNPRINFRDPITYRPVNFSTVEARSTDYTFGVRYAPTEDVALRASFATGFRPPSVAQTTPTETPTRQSGLVDPKRQLPPPAPQTRREPTFIYTNVRGGGPHLDPEESESFALGAVLTPRFLPGLRLSIDFTDIEKTGEITDLRFLFFNLQNLLINEDKFPGRVTRAPLTPADIAMGFEGGVITRVDFGLVNASRTSVRSFDMQADYEFDTSNGEFRVYALATHLKNYITQLFSDSDAVDGAGHLFRLNWRGNAGLTFRRPHWSMDWNMQYYDRYYVYPANATLSNPNPPQAVEQGSHTIPRQMYHDLTANIQLGEALGATRGILADTEVTLGLRNVFNTSPPIVATAFPTVGYSWYGDPRLRRYSISLRKSFR